MQSRWMLALLVLSTMFAGGCGGISQDDMRAHAIRRKKDDDEAPQQNNAAAKKAAASKKAQPAAQNPPGSKPAAGKGNSDADAPSVTVVADVPRTPLSPSASLEERRARSLANMKAIAQAIENHVEDHRFYPPISAQSDAGPTVSWRVLVLPQLGYQELYEQFATDEPWNSSTNYPLLSEIPPVFQSPGRTDGTTNYLVPDGSNTVFQPDGRVYPGRIEDGVENVLMLLEVDDSHAVPWTQPEDFPIRATETFDGLGTLRQDGVFAAFGGGHLALLPKDMNPRDFFQWTKIDDGGTRPPFVPMAAPATKQVAQGAGAAGGEKTTVAGGADSSQLSPETGSTGSILDQPQEAQERGREQVDHLKEKLQDPASLKPADLVDAGLRMLSGGEELEGMKYLHTAALVTSDEDTWHEKMKWVPALQRPLLALRWGVAVEYTGPEKYLKNPEPIKPQVRRTNRSGESSRSLSQYAGELRDIFYGSLTTRIRDGQWGPVLVHAHKHQNRSARRLTTGSRGLPPVNSWMTTGMTFVGIAPQHSQLIRAARQEGLDVLLLIKVNVRVTSQKQVYNSTEAQVIDLAPDKHERTLFATDALVNLRVEQQRKENLTEDPVQEQAERFEAFLESEFQMKPLPAALSPEHAAGRAAELAELEVEDPLPLLTEIRLYHLRDLITDRQLAAAYTSLIGRDAARSLVLGQTSERIGAVARWLPDPKDLPPPTRRR